MPILDRLLSGREDADAGTLGLLAPGYTALDFNIPGPQGDYLVPADSTLDQIIAARDLKDAFGLVDANGYPIEWGPVLRCMELLAHVIADLITAAAGLMVLDEKGNLVGLEKRINTPFGRMTVGALIRLMVERPDGGRTAGFQWWADAVFDACSGNFLCLPKNGALVRLRPSTAYVLLGSTGEYVYHVEPADDSFGFNQVWNEPRGKVIHARWPLHAGSRSPKRQLFSDAPVAAVRSATAIGQQVDAYIHHRFGPNQWREGVAMGKKEDFSPSGGKADKDFMESVMGWGVSERGVPFPWPKELVAVNLQHKMTDMQAGELRNQNVRAAGGIFGVPSPYLNEEVGSWGSGIEQMSRIFWRSSLKPKLRMLLAPFSLRLLPPGHQFVVDELEHVKGDWATTATLIAALTQSKAQGGPEIPGLDRFIERLIGVYRQPGARRVRADLPPPESFEEE